MVTISEALRMASARVYLLSHGRGQYQVNTYSERHRAWWEGQMTSDRRYAQRTAWEAKVCAALQLLKIEDADFLAHQATERERDRSMSLDWRQAVRDIVNQSKEV